MVRQFVPHGARDLVAQQVGIGAEIVRAPEEGPWAPGYYSLSFRDPEGIRLEVNHVPGRGVFEPGVQRSDVATGM